MGRERIRYFMTMAAMCGLVGSSVGICMGSCGLFYSAVAADLGLTKASVSLTYTITAFGAAFSGLSISRILRRENRLKALIIAGALLSSGGTILLSYASSLWMLYILAAVRGIGSGLLSFVLATSVINQWFLAKNGLMVSLAMAFSGLPSVLLANLFAGVIEARGWRFGYVTVAAVMLLFQMPALLYPVHLRPQTCGMKPYGYEEYLKYRQANPQSVIQQSNDHISMNSVKMILLLGFSVFVCIIAGVLQHLPSFALSLGFSASVGALMTSFASAANISSKLLFGVLTDKIGPYRSSLLCSVINIFAVVMLITLHTPVSMVICAFLFGFTFANSSTAMSMLTKDLYGMENYTRIYPLVSFSGSAANAAGVTLIGLLYDATGSYYIVFIMCIVLQALAMASVLTMNRMKTAEKTAA